MQRRNQQFSTDASLFSRLFSFPSYFNWIEYLMGLNQTLPLISDVCLFIFLDKGRMQ